MKKILKLLVSLGCFLSSTSYADIVTGILGGHGSSPDGIYTNYALIIFFLLSIISIITIVVLNNKNK